MQLNLSMMLSMMETSGGEKFSPKYLAQLAETLKLKGNKAMESKQYTKAIALYDCAIAFCENNAVYHCNRAAAYIEIHKHNEAMRDCLKSIEIDPNYSKGYTRLGVAYYALGNYRAAIDKGFKKALQLDPKNEAAKESIRVSQLKLIEQQQQSGSHYSHHQNTSSFSLSSSSVQGSGSKIHGAFNTGSVPVDFANMFTNMGATAYQGQHPEYNIRNTIVNGGIHLPKTASPICVVIRNSTVNGIDLPRTASSISVVIKNSIVNGVDQQFYTK
ncbi:PREDICTED: small glutamine-rich tetratricopeptide repeat-containing protein beta-like [Fragaria vesca subsp. vesca]|uniref:small glutamine-rich tetratricopeptide repeat-containing protein beta-like n=1 Tax=Fragaria vesca subsp. vesca TaxID=101020 RepID=UPI0002C366A6|nr:PREDICTED: small glutamine-rich tetratricopeptide repeat-containing protein beta-like [Fragaria vesca subsp. vesca]XP_011458780.1 PREDICTED: small glutamine-rich tetratricopeptide repeat-containing protein beta-like [Fragaria vesca subsp. vesca]